MIYLRFLVPPPKHTFEIGFFLRSSSLCTVQCALYEILTTYVSYKFHKKMSWAKKNFFSQINRKHQCSPFFMRMIWELWLNLWSWSLSSEREIESPQWAGLKSAIKGIFTVLSKSSIKIFSQYQLLFLLDVNQASKYFPQYQPGFLGCN